MKVLMVCLGNICRSPLAEGILDAKVKSLNLDWQVDSCGTSGWHDGALADSRSIKIAQQNNLDITNQRSRKLAKSDLDVFDLILAMDTSNYNDILKICDTEQQRNKVKMILNYRTPGMNQSVPDPYYNDGFPLVFEMLNEACEGLIKEYVHVSN